MNINGIRRSIRSQSRKFLFSLVRRIIFPLVKMDRRTVLFDHFNGLDVGCNPGYIAKKISETHAGFNVVWLISDKSSGRHNHWLSYAGNGFLAKSIALASAKVVVFNTLNSMAGWPKKRGQIWIQTGHGSFGIKKVGMDISSKRKRLIKTEARKTNIFISNSGFETSVFMSGFLYQHHQVVELGHARNDIFFNEELQEQVKANISDRYGLQGKNIVLFAPTHGKHDVSLIKKMKVDRVLQALHAKFGGEWVFGIRLHPRTRHKIEHGKLTLDNMSGPDVVDLSSHSDMQELLVSSEAVITDYSSGIFDFLLTKRPCFFHLDESLQEELRSSIYFGFDDTPIPVSSDASMLLENIGKFDRERFSHEVDAFLQGAGACENGDAAEKAASLIDGAAKGTSVTMLRSEYTHEAKMSARSGTATIIP